MINYAHVYGNITSSRLAVQNLNQLLKPGGDMLLSFIATNPIYSVYEKMFKMDKWKKYMQDVKKYISPLQHSKNPEEEYEKLLSDSGFTTRFCTVQDRKFTFTTAETFLRKYEM